MENDTKNNNDLKRSLKKNNRSKSMEAYEIKWGKKIGSRLANEAVKCSVGIGNWSKWSKKGDFL